MEDSSSNTESILLSEEIYPKLSTMLRSASDSVCLVSPFLNFSLVKEIIRITSPLVHITLITKWNLIDLLNGFNDLRVAPLLESRGNCELRLVPNLHAKYYRADSDVIFGSGNLTYSGLNAAQSGNLEIMVQVDRNFSGLSEFEDMIKKNSVIPTSELFEEIQYELEILRQNSVASPLAKDSVNSQMMVSARDWFPVCETPNALFEIYKKNTREMAFGVVNSGKRDLIFFDPPEQLNRQRLEAYLRIGMSQSILFSQAIQIIDSEGGIDDAKGRRILKALHPSMPDAEVNQSWEALKRWLIYFFPKKFVLAVE